MAEIQQVDVARLTWVDTKKQNRSYFQTPGLCYIGQNKLADM